MQSTLVPRSGVGDAFARRGSRGQKREIGRKIKGSGIDFPGKTVYNKSCCALFIAADRTIGSRRKRGSIMKQVSIYAENKKGTMQKITEILLREGINILGSVTNDSAEYGIVRMVVSDAAGASKALQEEGFICRLTEVIGVEVEDEVGNLNKMLTLLMDSNISVDYLYLSFNRDSGKPIMVFHCEDIMEVKSCLESGGYTVL